MKNTDFRIGNIIQDDHGRVCVVKSIGVHETVRLSPLSPEDGVWMESKSVSGCSPIPLTEEWLLKFGFECWGRKTVNEHEWFDRWVLYNAVCGTSNYEVHLSESNYGGIKESHISFSVDLNDIQHIQNTGHVHDLQNAYFICTGTELIPQETTDH